MRKFIKVILTPILRTLAKVYFSKPRKFQYLGIKAMIFPSVFHPQLTFSTKLLMDFIEPIDLKGKSFLELGCGSGVISVLAAKKGARVTASDIHHKALENTILNANRNTVSIHTIESDMFDTIPKNEYDYIIINPPYYPRNPESNADRAWFCGQDFEYFKKLFLSIKPFFNHASMVIMILSQDCEIDKIKGIAVENQITLQEIQQAKKVGEVNYIFRIENSLMLETV